MKKKEISKKLNLNKEVISALDAKSMGEVKGAGTVILSKCPCQGPVTGISFCIMC